MKISHGCYAHAMQSVAGDAGETGVRIVSQHGRHLRTTRFPRLRTVNPLI
jgi:hypothetical protein